MSSVAVAIGSGAVGAIIGLAAAQAGRIVAARREVDEHDIKARERNDQLVIWVDDATQNLVRELEEANQAAASRNAFHSSVHRADLSARKAGALHRYRDEEWKARFDLAALAFSEGRWHGLWRKRLGRPGPKLTAADTVAPFLARWREPITTGGQSGDDPVPVFDRTKRTTKDALDELPRLPLT
jgi:hypothetical protein